MSDTRPINTRDGLIMSNDFAYTERLQRELAASKKRIAELEAVAEAAVVVHEQGPLGNFSEWEVLGDALRAAGYLK